MKGSGGSSSPFPSSSPSFWPTLAPRKFDKELRKKGKGKGNTKTSERKREGHFDFDLFSPSEFQYPWGGISSDFFPLVEWTVSQKMFLWKSFFRPKQPCFCMNGLVFETILVENDGQCIRIMFIWKLTDADFFFDSHRQKFKKIKIKGYHNSENPSIRILQAPCIFLKNRSKIATRTWIHSC